MFRVEKQENFRLWLYFASDFGTISFPISAEDLLEDWARRWRSEGSPKGLVESEWH
jgi:hypothetical protein